jgi:hypothetical protein
MAMDNQIIANFKIIPNKAIRINYYTACIDFRLDYGLFYQFSYELSI